MKTIHVVLATTLLIPMLANAAPSTELIHRFEKIAAYNLKDPDSAKFRNEHLGHDLEGRPVLCGEINAKNSYGAYNGFTRFIAYDTDGQPAAWYENQNPTLFRMLWGNSCEK